MYWTFTRVLNMKYDKKINDSLIELEAKIDRWIEEANSGMLGSEFDDNFVEKSFQEYQLINGKVCSWIKGSNEILISRKLYGI